MKFLMCKLRALSGKRIGKTALLSILGFFAAVVLYLALLCHPGLFFRYSFTQGGVTLYSDEPIPPRPARQVLEEVEERLARSPFSQQRSTRGIRIYLCNRRWRFLLFANIRHQVGGLAYPPLSDNIFLRPVHLETNRLIGPSGQEVPDERTLSYFIAHEIMHVLVAGKLGAGRYLRLPAWKNEGYADRIAKGAAFDYETTVDQLRRGDRAMDPIRSGLYLRYHLLVAYLLDRKGITAHELLNGEFDPARLEEEILGADQRGKP
jgi:hypothetical protein